MNFKRILVAYDSSGFANRAFKAALDIVEPNNGNITIVTVVTGIYQPSIGFSMKFNKDLMKKHTKILQKIFSELKKEATEKGVKVSLKILQNPSVSKTIINYVNSSKFDVIVIGSHGRKGLNKIILGSVANDVAHKAKIPVMVVK